MKKSADPSKFKPATRLVVTGRAETDARGEARSRPVNPPIERGSTFLFDTYEDFTGYTGGTAYGRHGTSTHRALEENVTALEEGYATRLAPSGLAALAGGILAFAEAGGHILITDSAYGPTRTLATRFLPRFGVETEYYDPRIGGGISTLIRENTKLIVTESPGSMTFEVQDLPAIVTTAKARRVPVLVDNTWGAGHFLKPLNLGADVSVQAGTKYLVGHADALIGTITSADEETATKIAFALRMIGTAVSPDDAGLANRGLRTLPLRLERHQESGLALAEWLAGREEVARILHPARADHLDHNLWRRDFTGASGLFSVVLKPVPEPALAAFFNALSLFGMGYSWGGFESLCIPGRIKADRTAVPWTEEGALIRFHAGLEDLSDLCADLDQGFAAMAAAV